MPRTTSSTAFRETRRLASQRGQCIKQILRGSVLPVPALVHIRTTSSTTLPSVDFASQLADVLRRTRQQEGLTHRQIAQRIGISHATYTRLIRERESKR